MKIGTVGVSSTVSFVPSPTATPEQISTAQSSIDTFDWSDEAHEAWEVQQKKQAAINLGLAADSVPLAVRAGFRVTLDGFNADRALIGATLDLLIALADAVGATPIADQARAVRAQVPATMTMAQVEQLRQQAVLNE